MTFDLLSFPSQNLYYVVCVCCIHGGVTGLVTVADIFVIVDDEEVEEEDDDDDSEIHTVVYFWQVPAGHLSCVYYVTVVTVGTGCQQYGLVDIHI